MGNKKSSKKKKRSVRPVYKSINDLEPSRTGGQIALSGFTYQFLYSCYLILSESNENVNFTLEGLEDIDRYKCDFTSDTITHIQLKYSTQKQDASFLKDVLKNYLEVYLLDKTRDFKLVYNFDVAKGNLDKLFGYNLDEESKKYWDGIIEKLMVENDQWNWSDFSSNAFLDKITFEKRVKDDLSLEIEKLLIERYDITTDNIQLYANGIKVSCLEKMERRESITRKELDEIIHNINEDISKGIQNPAHGWIKKVDFNVIEAAEDNSYFEGKKATPQDIALGLPVRRIDTEKKVEDSISSNRVTVVKASSGQGKTTIALQVAFNLSNKYHVYQLTWCNDVREINNIINFFKARVKLGEKPLIIIDNLDSQLGEWNRLAQLLQEEITYNYKLLLTSREDDWYSYSGNLSNVKALRTVEISLNDQEAEGIFAQLKKRNLLHETIADWRHSWKKVEDKKLLIEYVYLLTHGEMISDRINHQISLISNSENGRIKCEILRIVCFADVCGIRLPVMNLVSNLEEPTSSDYGEILKGVENEFLISIDDNEKFVEGLHPVRSMHIVKRLHEYYAINATAINLIKLTDSKYLSKLFSKLPIWIDNKEEVYKDIMNLLWNSKSLSDYIMALKGLLSGSIDLYFKRHQEIFDDANDHGGLLLLSTELNPFVKFVGIDIDFSPLNDLRKTVPDNRNIQYLCNLRDKATEFDLTETDLFIFSKELFKFLNDKEPLVDLSSFALITYWLLNINQEFNLTKHINLEKVWENKYEYDAEILSNVMYVYFCGNKNKYLSFVEGNLDNILLYLKHSTNSLEIFVSEDKSKIHVEYALVPSNIGSGNEESVNRLKLICKALPIYETYCADAISPKLEALSGYDVFNNAHKTMPIRNIFSMFNQDFSSLWNHTIMSNYECDSMLEWVNQWINLRRQMIRLFSECEIILHKLLELKPRGKHPKIFDDLKSEINRKLIREMRYPNQERPFEIKVVIPSDFTKFKQEYFNSIQNFINQVVMLMNREQEQSRLAIINLSTAKETQSRMQEYFKDVIDNQDLSIDGYDEFCELERESLDSLMIACEYYVAHKPSKYFNKYSISSWYGKKKEQLISDSRTALNELEKIYNVSFPVDYFSVDILKHYPIIANNLNTEDPEEMIKFFYLCSPITSMGYDYLVIAIKSKINQVRPRGLKVPRNFLENLRVAIDERDEEMMDKLSAPFPYEISLNFLNCFEEEVNLMELRTSPYEGIDTIFELLWSYSISRDILKDKSNSDYLSDLLMGYEEKIKNLLKEFKGKIPAKEYGDTRQICCDVYNGKSFDDAELNTYIEKLISLYGNL